MAVVMHVLHIPLGELWEMDLEEISAWADEAKRFYVSSRPRGGL